MPLYDRSLAIREEVLGRDDPHVAVTLNGKAYLLTEKASVEGVDMRGLSV